MFCNDPKLRQFNNSMIISGEDVNGMLFEGADEKLLRRALAILENLGKCTMFKGDTSSEDGIKFF